MKILVSILGIGKYQKQKYRYWSIPNFCNVPSYKVPCRIYNII